MQNEIRRTDKYRIVGVNGGFEICHILTNKRGEIIEPRDEDFGVWAWSAYDLEKALRIANEIETGLKPIRQMDAQI